MQYTSILWIELWFFLVIFNKLKLPTVWGINFPVDNYA